MTDAMEALAKRIEETPVGQFAILLGLNDGTHFNEIIEARATIAAALRSPSPAALDPVTVEDIAQTLCGVDGNGFLDDCTPTQQEAYRIRAEAIHALIGQPRNAEAAAWRYRARGLKVWRLVLEDPTEALQKVSESGRVAEFYEIEPLCATSSDPQERAPATCVVCGAPAVGKCEGSVSSTHKIETDGPPCPTCGFRIRSKERPPLVIEDDTVSSNNGTEK